MKYRWCTSSFARFFASRAALTLAATVLAPLCLAQYVPTATVAGPVSPVAQGSAGQILTLSATVTSTSTVNSGTVWFYLLGARVAATVTNGAASTSFVVPEAMPAGAYPIEVTYVPDNGIHVTNFPKDNNIFTNLNQQYPNTGPGAPGSGQGTPNAAYVYDPAAYTSANIIGSGDLVTNGSVFLLSSDPSGHDFEQIASTLPISVNVSEATAVHLLTAAYGGTSYSVTFSGTGSATETFNSVNAPNFAGGGALNTESAVNGSATDNFFDQSVLQVQDQGGNYNGNSATGPFGNYFLYEQTFLLDSSFANQTLTSITISSGGGTLLLLGVTVDTTAGPLLASSGDNTGELVIGNPPAVVTWANPTAADAGPVPYSASSQTVSVNATVSAAATVDGGTVSFQLLGDAVSAPVSNGVASANLTVPGGTPPGSYPIVATYTPATSGTDTIYFTNFTKNNNIYAVINQEFPNTGASVPNGSYLYNPATFSAAGLVANSDQAGYPDSFLLTANSSGDDFEQVLNGAPQTLITSIGQATAVHLLTASYGGTNLTVTFTGDGGAVETFTNINVPDFCVGAGGPINTASMQNGSTANNVFDQSVLYLNDNGACYSGTTSNPKYTTYFLYEQTFLLSPAFASQNLISITISNNTGITLLLFGVTADGLLSSSTDSSHQLIVSQATPVITWANPADIVSGAALSSTQLDATANVPGTFVYIPPAGTVLSSGSSQTLSVSFTPNDTTDYSTATASVTISVDAPPAPTVTTAINVGPIVYSPNSSQSVTLSAGVTSSSTVNGGTVSFTLLGSTISAPVSGGAASVSFTVPAGTAAGTYSIDAAYNPANGLAASSDNTHQLSIGKAMPALTWSNPGSISGGTALGSTQLDATANVPGTFVYNPAAGTVLNVGSNQALAVTFTPTDTTDYTTATATVYINVTTPLAATQTLLGGPGNSSAGTLPYSPNSQTFLLVASVSSSSLPVTGGTVSFTVLGNTFTSTTVTNGVASATATVPAGTHPGVYAIQATYNPAAGYAGSNGNAYSVTITPAVPQITWVNPADIVAGTALGAAQLNAAASVPGTFVYSPRAGTVLNAGSHQALGVTFTPSDATDYAGATATVYINVDAGTSLTVTPSSWVQPYSPTAQFVTAPVQATLSISSPQNSGTVTFSVLIGSLLLPSSSCSVPVRKGVASILLSCAVPAGLPPGAYTIQATYTPPSGYAASTCTTQLNIARAAPVITWANPAIISFGTALSSTQLNATASVPGSFTYNPPMGTVLPEGSAESLSVTFEPTNYIDYAAQTASVTIGVAAPPAHLVVTPGSIYISSSCAVVTFGTVGPCLSPYNVVASVTLMNAGSAPLQNVQLTTGSATTSAAIESAFPVPQSIGTIAPGATVTTTVNFNFPLTKYPSGDAVVVVVGGTYTGGSFSSTTRGTMPLLGNPTGGE